MSLGKIIRDKREAMDLTLDEVSSKVGFSKPYLSTIETNKVNNPPSDELLLKLEQVLGFESGTLLYLAHVERMPSDIRDKFEYSEAENKRFRQIFKGLMQDKHTGRLKQLSAKDLRGLDEPGMPLSAGRLVPIINKVSAGYPAEFNDLDYPVGVADDYVRCPDMHDNNAFAVRVVGDSMEPKFNEGDIVVFSPAIEPKNGDDCFVRFTTPHETTFKRVFFEKGDMIRLQPRNEKYPPTMVESKRISGIYRAFARVERL
jgi:phage repressor protein C with HTH and peptisase S24 domain